MTDDTAVPSRFAYVAQQRPDWAKAFGGFFGAAYRPENPTLTEAERVLTYLTVLTAAGSVDSFRIHLADAAKVGLSREQILEALLLVTPAFGYQKVMDVVDHLRDYEPDA
ncbi:carboxymuconolactone decarboxylase family protein [Rhodococcoides yunnanense]|uniref:carboxymuconolactone decarboxylase family protein n=1 Tax=Rhodococcoides yunnanense TaxID=278209 RepID=UPI00093544FF|nr:carboxymuconolactone decarboxylase family protein [Rhodococcus yunnanensis]